MPAYTLEFTALWVTEAFNAIFLVDGSEYARVLTGVGAPIAPPAAPVKQGFVFEGWDPALPAAMPGQDVVFTALWQPVTDITLLAKDVSTTVINQTGGLIYGLAPGLSASDFENNYVVVTGAGELRITSPNGLFGTGTTVELLNAATSALVKTYTIVIYGDVNGDGSVDSIDAGTLVDVENYIITWDPAADAAFIQAADLNGDGEIDSIDAGITVDCENYIVTIDQSTGLVA